MTLFICYPRGCCDALPSWSTYPCLRVPHVFPHRCRSLPGAPKKRIIPGWHPSATKGLGGRCAGDPARGRHGRAAAQSTRPPGAGICHQKFRLAVFLFGKQHIVSVENQRMCVSISRSKRAAALASSGGHRGGQVPVIQDCFRDGDRQPDPIQGVSG